MPFSEINKAFDYMIEGESLRRIISMEDVVLSVCFGTLARYNASYACPISHSHWIQRKVGNQLAQLKCYIGVKCPCLCFERKKIIPKDGRKGRSKIPPRAALLLPLPSPTAKDVCSDAASDCKGCLLRRRLRLQRMSAPTPPPIANDVCCCCRYRLPAPTKTTKNWKTTRSGSDEDDEEWLR
ncbi:hypothetical protein ACLOJK_033942 [Asimina triloba]